MKIRICFFAALREALGTSEDFDGLSGMTAGDVRQQLVERGGRYAELLGPGRAVRCAWNRNLCEASQPLDAEGELAFFPPVTGG